MTRVVVLAAAVAFFTLPALAQTTAPPGKSGTAPGQTGKTPGQIQKEKDLPPGSAKDFAPGSKAPTALDPPGKTQKKK
jgi:hypothetical protein